MATEELPARSSQTVAEVLAQDHRSALSLTPALIRLYCVLAPACLVICATNGYDGSVVNGLQSLTVWNEDFNSPSGALLGIVSAAYALGAVTSTPFSAYVSDRYGRRWSVLIGSSIMIIGVIVQCTSHTIGVFIGGRIIVGFGITLALAAGPVLISELAHPRHRVFFTSMYNCSFYLGSLIAGWVAFGSYRIPNAWAWRLPTLLQALPACLQICCIMLLDESPRWLCYKDRADEAFNILVKHHGDGDRDHPLVLAEFAEMHEALLLEKEVQTVVLKLFLISPANRKRLAILVTLAIFGQWSGNGLISYYLSKILTSIGITSQREQTLLNGVSNTVNYITCLVVVSLSPKLRRRHMFIVGGCLMWLAFTVLTISIALTDEKGSVPASKTALGFIFIYFACYNICLNPLLYLFPTEILPYRLRAMGLSIVVFTNKAALFFNQFVNPIGMDSLGWKYYLVYVGWILVEIAVFYFLYPETKGYTLETLPEVFGEQVAFGKSHADETFDANGHDKSTHDESAHVEKDGSIA